VDISKAIDALADIESKLGIFCIDDGHFNFQIAQNTTATLTSNENKRKYYSDFIKSHRGYANKIARTVNNYSFYCNNPENSVFRRVKGMVVHTLTEYEIPIIFDSNEANNHSGLTVTFDAKQWQEIPEKIMVSMMEEIEDKLSNASVGTAFFTNFEEASPLLKSYAFNLVENDNVAVYMFSNLSPEAYKNSADFIASLEPMRALGISCLALESALNLTELWSPVYEN